MPLMVDRVINNIILFYKKRKKTLLYINIIIRGYIFFCPGAAYLDFPGNLLSSRIDVDRIVDKPIISSPPIIFPDIQNIQSAAKLLINAKNPLIIIGKGN